MGGKADVCTAWVKSLRAGLQLPPGHKEDAGTHIREFKSLGISFVA